jgi:hypothetical protein
MTGITFYRRRGRMSNDFEEGLAEIMEKNAKADAKADSWLDRIKASEYTPFVLAIGAATVGALVILAWLIG